MKLTRIEFPSTVSVAEFDVLSKRWSSSANVDLEINRPNDKKALETLFRFLLDRLPNALAFAVLSDLAECENVDDALLAELFRKGDTACRVSICLRDELSVELHQLCTASDDPDVIEHFRLKK